MNLYKKKECAWFCSRKDQFFEFSNMCGGFPIVYGKRVWKSTEHLYQASKYSKEVICCPVDTKNPTKIMHVRERIYSASNPMGAKMTQKCAVSSGLVRIDWEKVMVQNMLFVLELKTHQHFKTMSEILNETADRSIVEISRKDKFWGCQVVDTVNEIFEGHNTLGKLWMDVASRIDSIKEGNFQEPQKFFID